MQQLITIPRKHRQANNALNYSILNKKFSTASTLQPLANAALDYSLFIRNWINWLQEGTETLLTANVQADYR
jgi:hypothetical protein